MTNPTPEERRRIVEDITKPLRPSDATPEEKTLLKAREAQQRITSILKDVAEAKGYIEGGPLTSLAAKCFLDEFTKWDKEEVYFLLSATMAVDTVERLRSL